MRGSQGTIRHYTRYRFRSEARTALFWTLGICLYAGVLVAIYPSVKGAVDISAMPANLREAFNINDFSQLASFLAAELFGVILAIITPFFGIIMLSNIVAGAEERGRLDVLLGNPIPRWNLIVGSFVVAATYLLAIVLVLGLVLWIEASLLDLALSLRQAMRATFALWPLTLAFAALALAVSTLVRQRALAMGIPAAILFLMYLANVIGRLAPDISGIRWLSAYNYYGTAITEGIWWWGMVTLVIAALVLVGTAIVSFDRRDIYA